MARFRLIRTHIINGIACGPGSTVADSQSGAIPGDVVWEGFTPALISNAMVPLDPTAEWMVTQSPWPNGPSDPFAGGASSIAG
jgi:hypothetical protein